MRSMRFLQPLRRSALNHLPSTAVSESPIPIFEHHDASDRLTPTPHAAAHLQLNLPQLTPRHRYAVEHEQFLGVERLVRDGDRERDLDYM